MQKSQLVTLAYCLTKEDWRDLHHFVASPLQNKRTDVQDLLQYIEHYLPKVKNTHLQKEMAWEKLFPKKLYDDAAMRYIMYLAQQLMQQFLTLQAIQNDEIKLQLSFVKELRKRSASQKLIEIELKKLSQLFDKQSFKNFDYYYNAYEWQIERHEFAISQQRSATEGFTELSDNFNYYFIAEKLRQGCAALSRQSMNRDDFEIDFLPEVLSYIERKNEVLAIPIIAIYYHNYQSLIDIEDNIHFNKFKTLLFQANQHFPLNELRELYLYAINCCIRRLNAAKSEFVAEVFEIYRKGLETKALLENNTLSRFTYNNIVMAGVRLKEFDWTEKFIHEYKPFLEEKFRKNTFNHVLATFYFKKKDYTQAMRFLQNAEFDDVLHNLDARRMLLCIYYDLEEFDALDAHLEAFKNYLYRQKDLGYHRENCLNLIRFTRRLLHIDFSNTMEINNFKKEISNTTRLVEITWLLEKLEH